jgi:glucose-6-phosphate isomerase
MLDDLPIWQQLQKHQTSFSKFSLIDAFQQNSQRAQQFSAKCGELYVDLSKNLVTDTTLQLLLQLTEECGLKQKINDLFSGKIVNFSEEQPALHTHLRTNSATYPLVQQSLEKMASISEKIRLHQWYGYNGKAITDVINLGTGGSYLGPHMVTHALAAFNDTSIKQHFVANQQDKVLQRLLKHLNPETTLIIVSSKSFTTQETLHNFEFILTWLSNYTHREQALKQFIAITANPEKARSRGIQDEQIIPFLSAVGGRYSIWSAIGLPLCISNGFACFKEFLAGASAMDEHFLHTAFAQNIPVLLALIDVWYINFFTAKSLATLPYHQDLALLPHYLQQLSMESLGKCTTQEGAPITYQTGNIIWGGVGTTGQHAYHQLLHQGVEFTPCEFIVTYDEPYLFSQSLAQSRALMLGQNTGNPAKNCPGNRPSTLIIFPELTAHSLGLLLALYEHRVFTQAAIWGINPFDQWGVELGKNLGQALQDVVKYQQLTTDWDSSTKTLLTQYFNWKR